MTVILFAIVLLWSINECTKRHKQKKKDREIARVKEEQHRQREADRQLRAEWRRQEAEAAETARRVLALEREQIQLAREQARQAEQLAKHEERIAKLEYQMTQAEADIVAESERIAALFALMDIAAAEQAAAVPGSKTDVRAQKQIISYQASIHASEKRKAKAEFTKKTAQQKLSA